MDLLHLAAPCRNVPATFTLDDMTPSPFSAKLAAGLEVLFPACAGMRSVPARLAAVEIETSVPTADGWVRRWQRMDADKCARSAWRDVPEARARYELVVGDRVARYRHLPSDQRSLDGGARRRGHGVHPAERADARNLPTRQGPVRANNLRRFQAVMPPCQGKVAAVRPNTSSTRTMDIARKAP